MRSPRYRERIGAIQQTHQELERDSYQIAALDEGFELDQQEEIGPDVQHRAQVVNSPNGNVTRLWLIGKWAREHTKGDSRHTAKPQARVDERAVSELLDW